MRGVVADPQEIIVPYETGVAGIAARRQGEEFGELTFIRIQPGEHGFRTFGATTEHASYDDDTSVRQGDHIRSADSAVEFFPAPLGVGRLTRSEAAHFVSGFVTENAKGGSVILKHDGVLAGASW